MDDVALFASSRESVDDLPEALQPPTKRVSMIFSLSLAAANGVLFFCWAGIIAILLPLQISQIDPVNKVADLGIVIGVASLLATIGNPLAGALSDRTVSRFGRRRPWIFIGALTSVLALIILVFANTVFLLFLGWAAFQLTSNFVLAALTALVPDQVPEEQRGTVSGILGLSLPIGSIGGAMLFGQIIKVPAISYCVMIGAVVIVLIPFALFMHDKVLPLEYRTPFHLGVFLKNFWINPRKHPDFALGWLSRFIPLLGYFLAGSFLFYYLQDVVKYEQMFPGQSIQQGVAMLNIVSTLVSLISAVLGGILSDFFKRRKLFVILACLVLAASLLVYGFFPSWNMLLLASAISGFGLGAYMSVDIALISQVLPSAKDRAKDLGVANVATTLGQTLAPVLAAVVITQFHSYLILFITGAVITTLGSLLVQFIKSVR